MLNPAIIIEEIVFSTPNNLYLAVKDDRSTAMQSREMGGVERGAINIMLKSGSANPGHLHS